MYDQVSKYIVSVIIRLWCHAAHSSRKSCDDYDGKPGQLTWAGIPYERFGYKPTFAQVKAWIDNDQPFITLMPGHFRVIDGYSEIEDLSGGPTEYWVHLLDPLTKAGWTMWNGDATTTVWVGPSGTGGAPDVRLQTRMKIADGIADTMDDSDGDGLVDFDERYRFLTVPFLYGTDPLDSDTDDDGVPDKADMRGYVFDDAGGWQLRAADWTDSDTLRRNATLTMTTAERASKDGCEDGNHNGKLDAGETSNFDSRTTAPVRPRHPPATWSSSPPARSRWAATRRTTAATRATPTSCRCTRCTWTRIALTGPK